MSRRQFLHVQYSDCLTAGPLAGRLLVIDGLATEHAGLGLLGGPRWPVHRSHTLCYITYISTCLAATLGGKSL